MWSVFQKPGFVLLVASLGLTSGSEEQHNRELKPLSLSIPGCTPWGEWSAECFPCPEGRQVRQRTCFGQVEDDDDDDEEDSAVRLNSTEQYWVSNITRNCTCDLQSPEELFESPVEDIFESPDLDDSPLPDNSTVLDVAAGGGAAGGVAAGGIVGKVPEGCGWSAWSECFCDTKTMKRTRECDDDDTDEDENKNEETQPCACSAVMYEGENRLGKTFRVKLDKSQSPDCAHATKVGIAIVPIPGAPSAGHRRQLLNGFCSDSSFSANPLNAVSNAIGQWVFSVEGDHAASYAICIRTPEGVVAQFPENLDILGPSHIAVAGQSCAASDSKLDLPPASAINVRIQGTDLGRVEKWGLVNEGAFCPPLQVSAASESSGVTPVSGELEACILYDGQWFQFPTCAHITMVQRVAGDSSAAESTTTEQSSSTGLIVGIAVGISVGLAGLAAWGIMAYRNQSNKRELEVMFDILPDPNRDVSGAEATPFVESAAATRGSTHGSNTPGSLALTLRSRNSSPAKSNAVIRPPSTKRSRLSAPSSPTRQNIRRSPDHRLSQQQGHLVTEDVCHSPTAAQCSAPQSPTQGPQHRPWPKEDATRIWM